MENAPQPLISVPESTENPADHGWYVGRQGNGEYVVQHLPSGRMQMGFKSYAVACAWLEANWRGLTQ